MLPDKINRLTSSLVCFEPENILQNNSNYDARI